MIKSWKIGLVGTGFWSEKHLKAWSRIPNVELAALCNRSRGKLTEKAKAYEIPEDRLYTTVEEMLASCELDIVDIVTGPETHLAMVTAAARAGKHIMCQKPFAPTYAEAAEMVRVTEECGVRMMVTENWRWLEPFQLIRRVLDTGELGRIQAVRYIHSDYYTPRMEPSAVIPQPFFREMDKLLFYEMGAHWFDTWRFLFGTPERLYAQTSRISPYIRGEDSGIVVLSHRDFYGFMDMSWATRQKLDKPLGDSVSILHLEQLNIDGENGTLKLYTSGKITLIDREGKVERTIAESTKLDHEDSHFRLQSHFIDALENGAPFQTSGADNLDTLRLLFGVYESASLNMPINLNPDNPAASSFT